MTDTTRPICRGDWVKIRGYPGGPFQVIQLYVPQGHSMVHVHIGLTFGVREDHVERVEQPTLSERERLRMAGEGWRQRRDEGLKDVFVGEGRLS